MPEQTHIEVTALICYHIDTAPHLDESSREALCYNGRMKRIVLIDGENLVYGLRHLLGTDDTTADRSAIADFNFRGLLEEMLADNLPTQIFWFGAKLRIYNHLQPH